MISFGKVVGAMTWIRSESTIPYRNKDLWIAQKLAQNFAVILERLQLRHSQQDASDFEKKEANLVDTKKLLEKSLNFSSTIMSVSASVLQGLTLREFARVVLKQGLIALEADYGWIFSFNPENDYLYQIGALGYGEPSMDCRLLIREVIQNRSELFIETAEAWNQKLTISKDVHFSLDQRSFVGVPVSVGGDSIGVVAFAYLKNHVFTDDEKLFLRLLANQYAHALKFAHSTSQPQVFA
jgi:GAF domain-containing protein